MRQTSTRIICIISTTILSIAPRILGQPNTGSLHIAYDLPVQNHHYVTEKTILGKYRDLAACISNCDNTYGCRAVISHKKDKDRCFLTSVDFSSAHVNHRLKRDKVVHNAQYTVWMRKLSERYPGPAYLKHLECEQNWTKILHTETPLCIRFSIGVSGVNTSGYEAQVKKKNDKFCNEVLKPKGIPTSNLYIFGYGGHIEDALPPLPVMNAFEESLENGTPTPHPRLPVIYKAHNIDGRGVLHTAVWWANETIQEVSYFSVRPGHDKNKPEFPAYALCSYELRTAL